MLVLSKCYCDVFWDFISIFLGYSYFLFDFGFIVFLFCMWWGFLVRILGWDFFRFYIIKILNDDILLYIIVILYIYVIVIVDIFRCLFNNEYLRFNIYEVI